MSMKWSVDEVTRAVARRFLSAKWMTGENRFGDSDGLSEEKGVSYDLRLRRAAPVLL